MNKSNLIPANTLTVFVTVCILMTIILIATVAYIKQFKSHRKKIIGIWSILWLVIATIFSSGGVFGKFVDAETVHNKIYIKEELTQDLQQLEKSILTQSPLYFTDKNELRKQFANAYTEIEDGMTELEFYRLVNPIITSVGCGHTNLSISEALVRNREETAKFFPFKVALVNHQLFILEDDPKNNIHAGDKILSINDKSSEEIIDILINNISGDSSNKEKPKYIANRHFNNKYYNLIDNSGEYTIQVVDKHGNMKKMTIRGEYREAFNTTSWELLFADVQDKNFYDSYIQEDYAVLDINLFIQEKEEKFDAFVDKFFKELNEKNIDKLIIDIRGNYGGAPIAKSLLSYLISEETPYFTDDIPLLPKLVGFKKPIIPSENRFDGEVVVLTNGAVFSTSAHFIALVKYHRLGTIVGEETGATFICTDSSKDTVLNNTRLRLHYSTQVYKVAVKDLLETEGIQPDIKVSPTIEHILNKKDIQMERAIELLGLN